jgi:hypothetical protein
MQHENDRGGREIVERSTYRAERPIHNTCFKEFHMYLFAESSGGLPTSFLIFLFIMFMGMRQWVKIIKGNPVAGSLAKKGAMSLLGRLFK